MATTQTNGEEGATCPLCEDYTGPPSSVEAHISRKTDPTHLGEVGRAHRDDLQRQVDEVRRSAPTDAPSEDGDGTESTVPDGDVEETSEEVDDDQQDRVDDDQRRPDIDDDEFAEIPVEVDETGGEVDDDQQGDVDSGSVSTDAVAATGAAGTATLLSGLRGGGIKTWHVVALLVMVGVGWYLLQSSSSSNTARDDVDDQEASDEQSSSGEVWG